MLTLIIETSTAKPCLGLAEKGNLFASEIFTSKASHQAASHLAKLLKKNNLFPKDLKAVALGIGPGSYTGMRMGALLAEGISYSLKAPIVTFSSMEAFLPEEEGDFVVLFDAHLSGVYSLNGEKRDNVLRYANSYRLLSMENLPSFKNSVTFISPDAQKLKGRTPPGLLLLESFPNLEHLARLSYEKFQSKEFSYPPLNLEYRKDSNDLFLAEKRKIPYTLPLLS